MNEQYYEQRLAPAPAIRKNMMPLKRKSSTMMDSTSHDDHYHVQVGDLDYHHGGKELGSSTDNDYFDAIHFGHKNKRNKNHNHQFESKGSDTESEHNEVEEEKEEATTSDEHQQMDLDQIFPTNNGAVVPDIRNPFIPPVPRFSNLSCSKASVGSTNDRFYLRSFPSSTSWFLGPQATTSATNAIQPLHLPPMMVSEPPPLPPLIGEQQYKMNHNEPPSHVPASVNTLIADHVNLTLSSSLSPKRDSGKCKKESTNTGSHQAAAFNMKNREILLTFFLQNIHNPYPNQRQKRQLCAETGLSPAQLKNFYTNMRKRHWKPLKNGREPKSYIEFVLYKAMKQNDPNFS